MVCRPKQLVWVVAACATLFAPAIPQACCCPCAEPASICDQPCCAAETRAEACCCRLDARHDQPLVPAKGTAPSFEHHDQGAAPTAVVADVPQVVGVSREYLAASLAVPMRPPRILFGVWRN